MTGKLLSAMSCPTTCRYSPACGCGCHVALYSLAALHYLCRSAPRAASHRAARACLHQRRRLRSPKGDGLPSHAAAELALGDAARCLVHFARGAICDIRGGRADALRPLAHLACIAAGCCTRRHARILAARAGAARPRRRAACVASRRRRAFTANVAARRLRRARAGAAGLLPPPAAPGARQRGRQDARRHAARVRFARRAVRRPLS